MQNIWNRYRLAVIAVGVAVVGVFASLFVTPETHQAVIIRAGEPRVIVNMYRPDQPFGQTGAGLW